VTAPGSGPILLTRRLRLRPCAEADVPRLHALLTHPDVRRYLMDDIVVERQWVFDLASTDPPNRASIRVMERIGMRFLESVRTAGQPIVFYRIDREEWMRRRARRNGSTSGSAAR
jgi:RimJ/RimL family protein N-acetyltransferase